MRYVQLRAFHNVAVHGGFSRAAEALFLTQPAISDQVRKLEEEYDILLFHRKGKRTALTKQGERLLEITQRLFENETQALDMLSENRALTAGTLKIKVDSANHVLATLKAFRNDFPAVTIEIATGNTQEVVDSLYAYEADVGVMGSVPDNPDLDVIHLGGSSIIAFSAKSNPISTIKSLTLQQLSKLPLVLREPASRTRQKLETAAADLNLRLTPTIEAEGRETVYEIVASGVGIGFVSEKEFNQDVRLSAIRIKGRPIRMEEAVVSLKDRGGGKLIQAFVTMIRELTEENPPHA